MKTRAPAPTVGRSRLELKSRRNQVGGYWPTHGLNTADACGHTWKVIATMDRKEILQITIFVVGMACVAAIWLWFIAPSSVVTPP